MICKITSTNPDCLIGDIPFELRTNQKDTIRYCFSVDSCFLFYKGKCDTICSFDTTELFIYNKNLYNNDSIFELYDVIDISKALKDFNEPNLWASNDTMTAYIRVSVFRDTLPFIYRVEKREKITLSKKVGIGNWYYYNDSLVEDKTIKIDIKIWNKLLKINDNSTFFSSNRNFIFGLPNILVETKNKNEFKFVYFQECLLDLTKSEKKTYRRMIKILNSYSTIPNRKNI